MTAFNPPSILFFNGVTFNPEIIEGDTVVSGGGGDVTLAGNNVFTGANSFTNAAGIKVNDIDTTTITNLNIGKTNANQILLGSAANPIGITIAGTTNVYGDELVVNEDGGKKYVAVDACFFTTGTGGQATIDTKTAVPIHIAPSTSVEPNAICSGVVIGNSTIPINITGNSITLTGTTTAPTVSYPNNSTSVATTAYVTAAVAAGGGGGVTLGGTNVWTGANSFLAPSTINVATQATTDNSTLAASTAHVRSSFTSFRSTANTWTNTQSFTGATINVPNQAVGNNTTLAASTNFVGAAINALRGDANSWTNTQNFIGATITVPNQTIIITSNQTAANTLFVNNSIVSFLNTLKGSANTWSANNNFTTGSLDVTTQTAGNSTTLAASTAFVTGAISALSSVYQTAAQVATSISTELTNFLGTPHLWTADQDLHLVDVYVKTQLQSVISDVAASTSYVGLAVTNSLSANYSYIMTNTNNFTGVNTFTANTFVPTITTGTDTTQAASSAFVNASITAMKAAANTFSGINTFSGTNGFTTGIINVATQTAGNNTTLAASTAFVSAAISALSTIYQTAAEVTTAISSALTTFRGTANTFTANQIFPTIQFSTGTLNQQFRIQHTNGTGFGAIGAGAIVSVTFTYATLGMTNFTTLIAATISNSSGSGNGSRVIFSISAQSGSSFTVVGMNPTTTATANSAFTIIAYGR